MPDKKDIDILIINENIVRYYEALGKSLWLLSEFANIDVEDAEHALEDFAIAMKRITQLLHKQYNAREEVNDVLRNLKRKKDGQDNADNQTPG